MHRVQKSQKYLLHIFFKGNPMTILKRADVPKEQTWNRESVFESWDEYQAEYDAIAAKIPELADYKGRLSESPDTLVEYFDLLYPLRRRMGRLSVFIGLATAVDTSDKVAKSQAGQLNTLFGQFAATTAFATPELLSIGETLLEWADSDERLTIYKHHFDNLLRQKKHIQSPEVERLLGMLQDAFSGAFNTYGELVNSDLTFPDATDSQGINIVSHRKSCHRQALKIRIVNYVKMPGKNSVMVTKA